ncbi:glycosyl transferase family protein [Nitritalea halalkaliphila LW7]|uniref:Glycosyl transferase family protein n=1 Tax=Nitritalea halalkaliphila LW7 TaxID=1189621 RepID=I5C0M5_9BACT|nr:glycosyltransferase [Nitritalea halalkaliphila]EIM75377.1 glycosyl transferase family protein [Nitritalea halalkaliphila LW7]
MSQPSVFFSLVVPVYNRPDELRELLESVRQQSFRDFEVWVVEDGSTIPSQHLIQEFAQEFPLYYLPIPNSKQGFARNAGMRRAHGKYLLTVDSDVLLPENFFENLHRTLLHEDWDAFGGPDRGREDFTFFQKLTAFTMQATFTTGGIRGQLQDKSKFQLRGFNMGLKATVFHASGGFRDPNQGEDIELSIRLKNAGFRVGLIPEAFVYHRRRSTFTGFLRQCYSFGINRVNVSRYHPGAIQGVHLFPLFFAFYMLLLSASLPLGHLFGWPVHPQVQGLAFLPLGLWMLMGIGEGLWRERQSKRGALGLGAFLAPFVGICQLTAYGIGIAYGLLALRLPFLPSPFTVPLPERSAESGS